MVFGPFHYCAFCERAAPDAPETIDDQRRCTGCRYRTIYGGSRGSASLPAPAKWFGPITPIVWGFFDPAAVPHLQIKIEDEDEFEDDNRKPRRLEPSRALRMA